MAKGREIKLPLPAADDLFSTQEERDEAKREFIADIPLTEISDFPDHPYKVKQDESMLELAASIREKGVVNPALVRPKPEGGYEMVAGHRRKFASELAGKTVMPCIVRNLTDDEATIIMVDSNLQREKVLPSEKAFAYKMKLEAIKHQGITSRQVGEKLLSVTQVSKESDDSERQVQRYIRLTYLIPELLEMVDDGKIAFNPAVEISYLDQSEQRVLLNAMALNDCTPSHAQAIRLKKLSQEGVLQDQTIYDILAEQKPNQQEQYKFKREDIRKYFPKSYTDKQVCDTVIKLLEQWQRRRERDRDSR